MKPMPQNDDGSYTFYMDQDIFERLEAQRLHGESVDEAIQRIILLYNRSTH
jgi:hypothetical protein